MSQILKEYLILIILAALAVLAVVWYLKRQATAAAGVITKAATAYKADVDTVTGAATSPLSTAKDLFSSLFKTTKYISQEDQKAALAKINANLFKK